MAYLKIKNRAVSALAADITSTATSLSVTAGDGAQFPDSGNFNITIEDEILQCTAISTDTLTVTRAQEGTTAAAHTAGKAVELRITAGVQLLLNHHTPRCFWSFSRILFPVSAGTSISVGAIPSPAPLRSLSSVQVVLLSRTPAVILNSTALPAV